MSNAETIFIGIDLAWQTDKNNSGIAVARGDARGAVLVDHSEGIQSVEGVVEYVLSRATAHTVIAIDAPLILVNETGQRPCETDVSKRFGKYHAAANTTNLKRYPDAGSVRLASRLQEAGFQQVANPAPAKRRSGRWMFEVYPHPAQVTLFGLPRIIKYKKGAVAGRRAELDRLRKYLRDGLSGANPPLDASEPELLRGDISGMKGKFLKQYEDLLDACFCAYLALFLWHWGAERNEVFGDLDSGYIIVPTTTAV